MKKIIFMLLLCHMALCSRAQRQTTLLVNIKGLEVTDTLTLQWGANNRSADPHIMQCAAIKDCSFNVEIEEPRLVVLGIKGKHATFEILVSPGEQIVVSGRIKKYSTKLETEYFFRKMEVTGAVYQELYQKAMTAYRHHHDSVDACVQKEYKDVAKIVRKAKEISNEEAIAEMYQTLHGQSYIERVMGAYEEKEEYTNRIVFAHRNSFMGPLLLIRLNGRLGKEHKKLYDEMSADAKASLYGREVKDEVAPPTLHGEEAPSVALLDSVGNEILLQPTDFQCRYVLIDFWASWCQPCHKEIPNLKRVYNRYHQQGLRMISISVDHNEEDWIECLDEVKIPWENYLDVNRHAVQEYKVQYIPSIFVVDSQGRIVADKLRGTELTDFIDKLFE